VGAAIRCKRGRSWCSWTRKFRPWSNYTGGRVASVKEVPAAKASEVLPGRQQRESPPTAGRDLLTARKGTQALAEVGGQKALVAARVSPEKSPHRIKQNPFLRIADGTLVKEIAECFK